MRISIINFSGRVDGNCQSVSELLSHYYTGKSEQVDLFTCTSDRLDRCGDCDYECFKPGKSCPIGDGINAIYDSVAHADLSFFVMPNYCDYPCANYFAYNERGCGYFERDEEKKARYLSAKKKFIVVSNTRSDNFTKAFGYQIKQGEEVDILYLNPNKLIDNGSDANRSKFDNVKKLILAFAKDEWKIERSAMAIVVSNDEVLYTIEDIYGKCVLSLPKGHIEKGESRIDTAIRECQEETGIVLSKDDFVKEGTPYSYRFVDNYTLVKKIIYPVLFRQDHKGAPIYNEKDIKEIGYMKIHTFYNKCDYENVRCMLMDILHT